jgi:hypothetical protein
LGATWAENTGLIRNRQERAALQWLREYMQTDAAKNAKSPFPGTKKEASIYIRPASLKVAAGDVLPIKIHARLATKTIQKVDLYVNDELVKTMTEVPYIVEHTAKKASWNTMKAVVTATDGTTYERYGGFTVAKGTKRSPYNGTPTEIPGIVKANEYDKGLVDVTYSSGASRSNPMSVSNGQWMDYTVDVKEEGLYTMDLEVASAIAGGRFHLAEYSFDNIEFLTDFTDVPNTGSTTEFQPVHCSIKKYLTAGKHVFTLLVEKGGFYIKDMTFKLLPTFAMPGTVEAEDFVTNKGGSVVTINGGFAWGNAANGDYAEYSVKVNQAGKYAYEATVASEVSGSKFTMKLIDSEGNETSMPLVKVPNKGKDTYEVKTGNVKTAFKEGLHTLRINVTGGTCNIDKIKFTCTEPASGIDEIMSDDASNAPAYNLMGVPVNAGYRGIVIKNGKKMFVK